MSSQKKALLQDSFIYIDLNHNYQLLSVICKQQAALHPQLLNRLP